MAMHAEATPAEAAPAAAAPAEAAPPLRWKAPPSHRPSHWPPAPPPPTPPAELQATPPAPPPPRAGPTPETQYVDPTLQSSVVIEEVSDTVPTPVPQYFNMAAQDETSSGSSSSSTTNSTGWDLVSHPLSKWSHVSQ